MRSRILAWIELGVIVLPLAALSMLVLAQSLVHPSAASFAVWAVSFAALIGGGIALAALASAGRQALKRLPVVVWLLVATGSLLTLLGLIAIAAAPESLLIVFAFGAPALIPAGHVLYEVRRAHT